MDTALRDSAVLSSVDNHFVVDTSKSKRIDPKDMPVSEYLMVTEDYSGERVLYSRGILRGIPVYGENLCPPKPVSSQKSVLTAVRTSACRNELRATLDALASPKDHTRAIH